MKKLLFLPLLLFPTLAFSWSGNFTPSKKVDVAGATTALYATVTTDIATATNAVYTTLDAAKANTSGATFTGTIYTQDVIPTADNTYTLGTSLNRYSELWVNSSSVHIGDATISYDGNITFDKNLDMQSDAVTTDAWEKNSTTVYSGSLGSGDFDILVSIDSDISDVAYTASGTDYKDTVVFYILMGSAPFILGGDAVQIFSDKLDDGNLTLLESASADNANKYWNSTSGQIYFRGELTGGLTEFSGLTVTFSGAAITSTGSGNQYIKIDRGTITTGNNTMIFISGNSVASVVDLSNATNSLYGTVTSDISSATTTIYSTLTTDIATATYNAKTTADTDYINVTGDTMTGQLVYNDLILNTSATYKSAQDYFNQLNSAGWIDGGDFSSNGDGSITVGSGSGLIRTSNDPNAPLVSFDWAENTSVSLVDQSGNYISINYNSGSPQITSSTSNPANGNNIFNLGYAFREGTDADFVEAGQVLRNGHKMIIQRFNAKGNIELTSGGLVAETGNRYLTVTSGTLYAGITRVLTSAIDTSGTDTFEYYYLSNTITNTWSYYDETANTINNSVYNNNGTLTNIKSNRYRTDFAYLTYSGELIVILGNNNDTLANAQVVNPPSNLPAHASEFAALIAKIIVKQGATNLQEVGNLQGTLFTSSGVVIHNETSSKQGGNGTDEYYHLTNSDYINVTNSAWINATGDTMTGTLNMSSNIIPTADNTYTLGTSINRFAELWVNSSSIYIGDATIGYNGTSITFNKNLVLPSITYSKVFNYFNYFEAGALNWTGICVDQNNTLYATILSGSIYKSVDDGVTWTDLSTTSRLWFGIVADSNNTIFALAIGASAELYKSVDGGANWIDLNVGIASISAVGIDNNDVLYLGVDGGSIYKSINGGDSWTNLSTTNRSWKDIAADADNNLYAVVSEGSIYKSVNGGDSWTDLVSGNREWSAIDVDSTGRVYAVVNGGSIYYSDDGGANWIDLDADNIAYSGIAFGENDIAYISARSVDILSYYWVSGTGAIINGDGETYFSGGSVGINTDSIDTSAALEIDSTTGSLLLPRMTTTQRDALTAVNGMIIYNITTTQIEGYENGSWVDL